VIEEMQSLNAVFKLQLPLSLPDKKRFARHFWPNNVPVNHNIVVKIIPWDGPFRKALFSDIVRHGFTKEMFMAILNQASAPRVPTTRTSNFKCTSMTGFLRLKFDHIWVFVLADGARLIMYRSQDGNTFYVLNYFSFAEHSEYATRLNHLNTLFANTFRYGDGMTLYADKLQNGVWILGTMPLEFGF